MEKETGRMEAFSDGIFGVAITLLGIEIGVDLKEMHAGISNQSLAHELMALWPKYFAYVNSFATVLILWMTHHRIFKMLRRTSIQLQLSNGLLLLLIALVPFPTKTVAEFIFTPALNTAVVFYVGYFILVSIAFISLTMLIRSRDKLRMPHISKAVLDKLVKGQLAGMACNVAIIICAVFYPTIAPVLYFRDVDFLGLHDRRRAGGGRNNELIDILAEVPLAFNRKSKSPKYLSIL